MGVALENARLFDETKRLLAETDARAAELAVINEIGEALARQLDFQAIVELVGERIRTLFDSRSMLISMYDESTGMITFPYEIDDGLRYRSDPIAFGSGLTSQIIRTKRPIRLGTNDEAIALGAILPEPCPRRADPRRHLERVPRPRASTRAARRVLAGRADPDRRPRDRCHLA